MSVYDNAKLVAGSRTDDNNKIIGIDNDFMKAYIDIADNVNACTLYRDVSHSYYNDNVIGDIVDDYINKGISKDKFIRQLSACYGNLFNRMNEGIWSGLCRKVGWR